MIHPTAIISEKSSLGKNVEIGPYCIIGDDVHIGDGCKLHSHVVIEGHSTIGKNNTFFPFSAIGLKTQDLKYNGGPTYLKIGDNNIFRENTTIHSSTFEDTVTSIGNDNYFLAYAHVAHECKVHNNVIFSNNATIAGHVEVFDHVIISGFGGIHQFCKIGAHSIIGGCTKIVKDIPPFTMADGNPAAIRGINTVGLERRGFAIGDIKALRMAYRKLFLKKDQNLAVLLKQFTDHEAAENPHVQELLSFISTTERGVTR